MKPISLLLPTRISFGDGCSVEGATHLLDRGSSRILIITSSPVVALVSPIQEILEQKAKVQVIDSVNAEPTIDDFERLRGEARQFHPDTVLGIGGG